MKGRGKKNWEKAVRQTAMSMSTAQVLIEQQCLTKPKIWTEPNTDTFFDTKIFGNRYQYFFRYQIFSKPILILLSIPKFFETDADTIKKWKSFETERFQNRNDTLCFHCHVQAPIFTFTLQAPNFQQKPRWIWARKEEVQMLAKNVMYTQPALSRSPFRQQIISNLKTKKHKSKFENLNLNWFLHETTIHAKFSAVFGTRGFSCS